MRMYDVIIKKRNGLSLTAEEIDQMITGYVTGIIPDYQMSAFLMAVYFKGMTEQETWAMTNAVAHSGDMVDLSKVKGVKVDKHSTGGVGDKTTLVVAPIVAACGVKVAKMSGRGLGHTGGTIDKLESIPGFQTSLSKEQFIRVVNQTGLSIVGQSGNLAPADKKLYALRDVTATVDSIPLIAVSIMGKKLAAGNDGILLDVKMGSGAFVKTIEDAILLAKEMVNIGENAGKRTIALITNMDIPLGCNIGNSLEVIEAVQALQGQAPKDLQYLCRHLAGNMLHLAGKGSLEKCMSMVDVVISDGSALERLIAMVEAQGGESNVIRDTNTFLQAPYREDVLALQSGYITHMDTQSCGIAASILGAGREKKESTIDALAGIVLHHKVGEHVEAGQSIATMYASNQTLFEAARKRYADAITIEQKKPEDTPLIYARVTKEQVEMYE
ncbi:MAG: pyrimidine-nucleoside phosphorylase [Lachnospiraceae bacterium]